MHFKSNNVSLTSHLSAILIMMNVKKRRRNKKQKTHSTMKHFNYLGKSPELRQIIVAIGPIVISGVLGMTEGYSAVLLPQLQDENSTIKVNTQMSSWIASMSALPMAGGCIMAGYLMEKIGRRNAHILCCLPIIVGSFLIAMASNSTVILIGRFITGVGDGFIGPIAGVYIAETSQPSIRGVLINSTNASISLGLLLVHLLGTYFSWQVTAWVTGIIPIPFAILMFFIPESPTFLAKRKRIEEAQKAFYWCRGNSKDSQKELKELIERQRELNNATKISISDHIRSITKPELWKPTVIISVLFFTSQITGHNAFVAYSIHFMRECGLSGEIFDEYLAMIIVDSFRLVSLILSCVLVNKMTRRSLTMLSGYGVISVLTLLCSYLYLAPRIAFHSSALLLVLLIAYVCFVCVGLIPLSWTIMAEVFPLAHRGFGTGVTNAVCFGFLYIVVQTYPHLLDYFGNIFGVFAFYGVCTLGGMIFLTKFLPETKDKPLYVIEDNFKSKNCTEKSQPDN